MDFSWQECCSGVPPCGVAISPSTVPSSAAAVSSSKQANPRSATARMMRRQVRNDTQKHRSYLGLCIDSLECSRLNTFLLDSYKTATLTMHTLFAFIQSIIKDGALAGAADDDSEKIYRQSEAGDEEHGVQHEVHDHVHPDVQDDDDASPTRKTIIHYHNYYVTNYVGCDLPPRKNREL